MYRKTLGPFAPLHQNKIISGGPEIGLDFEGTVARDKIYFVLLINPIVWLHAV